MGMYPWFCCPSSWNIIQYAPILGELAAQKGLKRGCALPLPEPRLIVGTPRFYPERKRDSNQENVKP